MGRLVGFWSGSRGGSMSHPALLMTVGQLVSERPERAALFERLGIDYCCCDRQALGEACEHGHVDPKQVLSGLVQLESAGPVSDETDWSIRPLGELVDHITEKHHAYLNDALPRLSYLINKVWEAHVRLHPELSDVAEEFAALRTELERHMQDEERVLFPLCRSIETAGSARPGGKRSLLEMIHRLEDEHVDSSRSFQRLRELTEDFTPPVDGCPTYRVMLSSLAELEEDLRKHVYKENCLLFPRALEMEAGR